MEAFLCGVCNIADGGSALLFIFSGSRVTRKSMVTGNRNLREIASVLTQHRHASSIAGGKAPSVERFARDDSVSDFLRP
jgi:hypothetical protein